MRHYRQIDTDRPDPLPHRLPPSHRELGTLRVESMMTLHVFFSYMHIVKLVFWPENYLKNLNSFDFFELHGWPILRAHLFFFSCNKIMQRSVSETSRSLSFSF